MTRSLFGALLAVGLALAGNHTALGQDLQPPPENGLKSAAFAGGCFWCMVHPFDSLPGVVAVTSGYTGGRVANPSYEQVSSGTTGHAESVRVDYDPKKISYQTLLEVYWRNVDPVDADGQFCDRGNQYRTAIFFADDEQRRLAETSKGAMARRLSRPLATEIVPAGPFYRAEGYHQNYYRVNPLHYHFYRSRCGRDDRLQQLWGGEAGGAGVVPGAGGP
jgi:peptide-methionine (S)-S-oxide reductase